MTDHFNSFLRYLQNVDFPKELFGHVLILAATHAKTVSDRSTQRAQEYARGVVKAAYESEAQIHEEPQYRQHLVHLVNKLASGPRFLPMAKTDTAQWFAHGDHFGQI